MKTFSKRGRESAALYCQMMADFFIRPGCGCPVPEFEGDAWDLFAAAFALAGTEVLTSDDWQGGNTHNARRYAATEAILRTGWNP